MDNLSLQPGDKLYFVGIAGVGMSATAALARLAGLEVSGSDHGVYEPSLSVLNSQKIYFFNSYEASHVETANATAYVLSSREDEQNPEVAWLLANDKKIVSFPEVLASLADDKIRLVVGGTHGKSTTSAWLGYVLKALEDSSFMVGAVLAQYPTNFYGGGGHYFIFEGDEYKSLFNDPTPKMKYYNADVLVLNNLELDHPDLYASIDELKDEFADCIHSLPDDGFVVYNADSADLSQVVYPAGKRSFSFGVENNADVKLLSHEVKSGYTEISVEVKLDPENPKTEQYRLALPGLYNVYNALAVITTLRALGFQVEHIAPHLESFLGVKRRFERLEDSKELVVIDDYAHHPTAVRATLEAVKEFYPGRRVWAVFEPHTFSRTEKLLEDLAASFQGSDEVLLAPIYGAQDPAKETHVTNESLLAAVKHNHMHARSVSGRDEVVSILKAEVKKGDVIVVMSVGSFNTVAWEIKNTLRFL